MVCIYCGGKTQVINSRLQKRLNRTWRRRECVQCHAVFTTEETADLHTSIAVQMASATLCPFNRDKLFASVFKSLGHRANPIDDASALTDTIIAKVLGQTAKAVIDPAYIAHTAYDTLERFDKAAGVQYRAYHARYF